MEEIERMLNNWALWVFSGRSSISSISPYPAYNLAPPPPRSGSTMPILSGEAEELDKIIQGIDQRLGRAIAVFYLWNDTQEQKAKRCGVCVNTFKDRLGRGKEAVKAEWYRRRAMRREKKALAF